MFGSRRSWQLFTLGTVLLISVSARTVAAQSTPLTVVQSSDGTLHLTQAKNVWTVTPKPITDDDLGTLNMSGEVDGTIPAALLSGPGAANVLQAVQGSDGTLYIGQGSNAWTLVPNQISDADLAGLTGAGVLNGQIWPLPRTYVNSPFAGTGSDGFSGDGGPATAAQLRLPAGVAIGNDGSVYIADTLNQRIRRVAPGGNIATVAGSGSPATTFPPSSDPLIPGGFTGDGGPATAAHLNGPEGVAVGPDGSLYIADTTNQRVRRVAPNGIISTIAGSDSFGSFSGDGGPATAARLNDPRGLAFGPDGSLYVADTHNNRVRRVAPNGTISTFAGTSIGIGFGGDNGPATEADLRGPVGVAVAQDGNVYISDTNNRIRRVAPDGTISTFAGRGSSAYPGFSGDGGPATEATLFLGDISGVGVGPDGSVYIADTQNERIRRVTPDGIISTIESTGTAVPWGVAVGPDGSVYYTTALNQKVSSNTSRVWRISS